MATDIDLIPLKVNRAQSVANERANGTPANTQLILSDKLIVGILISGL